jgi:hypothetical protein
MYKAGFPNIDPLHQDAYRVYDAVQACASIMKREVMASARPPKPNTLTLQAQAWPASTMATGWSDGDRPVRDLGDACPCKMAGATTYAPFSMKRLLEPHFSLTSK